MLLYTITVSNMGIEMYLTSNHDDKNKNSRFLHRGEFIYNVGSLVFGAGIALLAVGILIVILFKIHYGSESQEILISIFFAGLGVSLIPFGLNMMMKQTKYGYPVVFSSSILSFIAISIFTFTYPHSWYYPLISYTLALYVFGFLAMIANAFFNVTLHIMEGDSKSKDYKEKNLKIYTDEEIEKDIEDALKKSTEFIASELQFKIDETENFRLGKAFNSNCSTVIRVKDDIDETKNLSFTMHPGETEKWGSVGIEKDSKLLANALQENTNKAGRFETFFERFIQRFKEITHITR